MNVEELVEDVDRLQHRPDGRAERAVAEQLLDQLAAGRRSTGWPVSGSTPAICVSSV